MRLSPCDTGKLLRLDPVIVCVRVIMDIIEEKKEE